MTLILCLERDSEALDALDRRVRSLGYDTAGGRDVVDAFATLGARDADLVIAGESLTSVDDAALLERVRPDDSMPPILAIAAPDSPRGEWLAARMPAIALMAPRFSLGALGFALDHALRAARLRRNAREVRERRHRLDGPDPLVGESRERARMLERIEQAASTNSDVWVCGEPGVGKGRVARAIHDRSARRAGAFVALRFGAASNGALEHAVHGIAEAIESARGGSLVLEDVEKLSLELQGDLLQTLRERTSARSVAEGSPEANGAAFDRVRLIATLAGDPREEVRAGRLSPELLERLGPDTVRVPALRERVDDLPALVRHLVERASLRLGILERPPCGAEFDRMRAYEWPGNLAELANAIERMLILSRCDSAARAASGGRERGETPGGDGGARTRPWAFPPVPIAPGDDQFNLERIKREAVDRALIATGGNRRRAAALLGVTDRTLRNLFQRGASKRRRAD
jgi:DNA-binding NtrC family response regulator